MKIAGIIAEYNPFHTGHLFHLEKTREAGFSHIRQYGELKFRAPKPGEGRIFFAARKEF